MAKIQNLLNYLLLAVLSGCATDRLTPVSEAPPRSIGPELTVFPPSEKSPASIVPADVSSLSAVADPTHVTIVNPQVDSSDVRLSGVEVQQFTDSTTRQRLTAIFLAEVGTREIGKNNHGPGPKKYLAVCNLPEGYAYCACFVKWALLESGITTRGTAWSPSWATGKEIYWKQGKFIKAFDLSSRAESRDQADNGVRLSGVEAPQPGDVFTLYYQNLKRVGHVGFVHIWDDPRADDWVFTVEGNTNGEGSREGDGVHARRRLKRSLYTIGNYIDT